MTLLKRPRLLSLALVCTGLQCASAWPQAEQLKDTIRAKPCEDLPHSDHPHARIGNGVVSAVVYLPDAENGYYRGSRFDWSGIVACASMHGHEFFGEWFSHYDPTLNDAVTGPAEEFRHPVSEIGYDEALPGGEFLKIGVGVLRRLDSKPYRFGNNYPITDHGSWTTKPGKRAIAFKQVLHTAFGYSYVYEKTLRFDRRGSVLTVSHRLRNIGSKSLDTAVYSHDFFLLDRQPIAPGTELRFPFVPILDHPLPGTATQEGKTVRIVSRMEPRQGIGAYVTGFSSSARDFDFTFEDTGRGIGIEQTANAPLVKMYLWGTPKTLCPEGYIGIHVAPGARQTWAVQYRFFTR